MGRVTTLQEFLAEIQKIGKTENTRFYRGHSNKNYEIKPSIYRDEKYIENEDKIYKEVIVRVPNEFEGKTTIEALTMMQHYDVPTRILDITSNSLVALYFACLGSDKTDAEVLVFDIPEDDVCFSDSDRVTVLANLVKCDKYFYYDKDLILMYEYCIEIMNTEGRRIKREAPTPIHYRKLIHNLKNSPHKEKFANYIKVGKESLVKIFRQEKHIINNIIPAIEDLVSSFEYFNDFKPQFKKEDIEKLLRISFYKKVELLALEAIKETVSKINQEYFGKLLHNIREDKSYFQPIINPNDVNSVLTVKPKLNNPRIIRQQGAFLIFGIIEMNIDSSFEIKPMAKLNEDWILRGEKQNNPNSERIIISKNKKKRILDELDELGINQATLFPEIDKVGAYIKEKFEK